MIVKKGKNEQAIKNTKLQLAIEEFVEIKKQIDTLNDELKEHKDLIIAEAKANIGEENIVTVSFILDDESGVKITFNSDIKIIDVNALSMLLGNKFDVLVKAETTYKPERKLKELALNDDGLKECLEVREKAPSITLV